MSAKSSENKNHTVTPKRPSAELRAKARLITRR